MKTVGLIVAAVVLVVIGAPVVAAVALMAVGTPAAGEVIRAKPCEGNPLSLHWRAPFEQGYTVATGFGHSRQAGGPPLEGVDLVSAQQPGQVLAAAPGRVTSTATQANGARTVEIEHQHGITTRYVHLGQISEGLTAGSEVSIGEPLGTEGGTGTTAGTLLHFQVLVDGVPTDPVQFMREHGAPLNGAATQQAIAVDVDDEEILEGGVGFELPEPGEPRKDSLTNPALSVPEDIAALYEQAGGDYGIPGTLLAGIGMAETAHGRNTAESPAGAQGLMQFMPETFAAFGVDGDGDGIADIHNDADSIFSAANYLTLSGVQNGPDGVREALYTYNQADWYVNDVLFYAHEYGGGVVIGDPIICDDPGPGNPELPPLTDERIERMFARAQLELGDPYVLGAEGPDAWDCSSFARMAFAEIGITMPRTARAQRDWLASGNGFRVPLGQEKPGDLVFWDSYRGPNEIGHVMIVWDPANMSTIEAKIPAVSHGDYTGGVEKNIFEIWRVGNIADDPEGVT